MLTFFIFGSGSTLAADKPVWELRVTTAEIDGECLHNQTWQGVSGRYHQWDLIRIDDPKNYTGKIGEATWQFVQHHKYSFLFRKDAANGSSMRNGNLFFNLDLIDEDTLDFYRKAAKASVGTNPYGYVDNIRRDLKKPHLLPATVVRHAYERELYDLNRLNSFNPFEVNIDNRQVVIPVERSVCDLKVIYLMNNAKARYTKNALGKRTLISDDTKPTNMGKKTFAEEWLEAQ